MRSTANLSPAALTASHRERLIAELRTDRKLAAEYLNAAAEDKDRRIYLSALRTVAEARGVAKVAKAAGAPRTKKRQSAAIAAAADASIDYKRRKPAR